MTPALFVVSYRPRSHAGPKTSKVTTLPMTADAAEKLAFCLNLQGYPAEVLPAPKPKTMTATAGVLP